jgi:hypothetical protein
MLAGRAVVIVRRSEADGVKPMNAILNDLFALGLFVALVVGPGFVLGWELSHHRTMPPIRIERSQRPRWYWTCIVAHSALLALLVLVFLFLAFAFFVLPGLYN